MELTEESKPLTAFLTPFGIFVWNVLPFGLTNGPPKYSRLVERVYGDLPRTKTFVDDTGIGHRMESEIVADLRQVLCRARAARLKFKPKKVFIGHKQLEFLGHTLSKEGISPEASKVAKVQGFQRPQTREQLQSFIGLVSYYRRFVKDFGRIAYPLTSVKNLPPKECMKRWGDEQEVAFKELKTVLCSAPILAKPHFDKPFILDTDASQYAVGAVLSQIGCDKQEHPIFYYSRVLTPAEKNYSVTEKECLAMVTAVSKFRAYILGNRTTIRTDHAPIMGLLWRTDLTGRCARWQCLLSEYELILQTRSGKTHQNADGLS